MIISEYSSDTLAIDRFACENDEAWCVYGSNASGIADFVKLLEQQKHPSIHGNETRATLSFATQQRIFEDELRKDNSDFIDCLDPGTPAQDFIDDADKHREIIRAFNMEKCLARGYRQLSSGESRKLVLLGALSRQPDILIIENPYDGLDQEGCRELDKTLSKLKEQGQRIIVVVNNPDDIPDWCSHLAIIIQGVIASQGRLDKTLPHLPDENDSPHPLLSLTYTRQGGAAEQELVNLHSGRASYGQVEIFSNLNFRVVSGQHTLITGVNGSGKSTLLQMITGDNHNCYGNDLRIFGVQRGSGESIWQLKEKMGIVSPDLHRNYYLPGSALQTVVSGFFDSIGVYRQVTGKQRKDAQLWLAKLGLSAKAALPFRSLSYSEQRLCLIARALIKSPQLLILDEPTQGLDHYNRMAILDFLQLIATKKITTILYASHRTDEFRSFFQQHIHLSG